MRRFQMAIWLGLGLAVPTVSASADPLSDCAQARNLDVRVKGCSEIIAGASFDTGQKSVAFRNRGTARAEAGAFGQAIADLDEAIRLAPGDAVALTGRANARLAAGQTDGAITDYGAALNIAPRNYAALIGRGHAHLVKRNADMAIADFTAGIGIDPNSASAFNNRGLAWRSKGDNDRAIADYTSAIMLNPIYALAYNNRGYAHEGKGMKVEAVADFTRALQLDGSLVGASAGLKRLKATAGPLEQSERLVGQGRALVEANCARCHAVGGSGASPNSNAPPFREIQKRHPVLALREPLTRGIAAPHDEMPKFKFGEADIDTIVAYINSLQGAGKR